MNVALPMPNFHDLWPRLVASLPAVLLVLVGAYVAHFFMLRAMRLLAKHSDLAERETRPISRALDWIIFIAALVLIFNVFGFNLGGVWTMLTTVLAMIAVGFVAVWSVLSNVLCTILILITRPFSIGDEIEFLGDPTKGRVVDLNFIFTTLAAEDGGEIRIPNNLFFQKVLKRKRGSNTRSLSEQLSAPPKE